MAVAVSLARMPESRALLAVGERRSERGSEGGSLRKSFDASEAARWKDEVSESPAQACLFLLGERGVLHITWGGPVGGKGAGVIVCPSLLPRRNHVVR